MKTKELNEDILDDDYPVYVGYCYVCEGKVTVSPVTGTVGSLKRSLGCNEVRRCDMVGRGMFGGGEK